jgi:hypothetical protein
MRLLIVLPVLALAACSPKEKTTTDSPNASTMSAAPGAAVDPATYAGTWDGKVMPMAKDTTVTTVSLTATTTTAGWTMKVGGGADVPLTVVTGGDSVIATAANFPSGVRKGATVKSLHGVFRTHGDMMMGTIHATYDNGDTASYRTESTRKK